jgi:glycosyltransferase involved in cell wall biosynthesis
MKLLSIIVPVYNEENNIGILISKLKNLDLSELNFQKEIIVVNDGSRDNSKAVIESFDEIILINQENQGKGSAVQNGIDLAKGDYILVQDGDLEYEPFDIIKMCNQLKTFEKISIYGSRYKPLYLGLFPKYYDKQNISSYLANIFFIFLFFLFYNKFITDPLTGYKLYQRKFFDNNHICSKGFEADHEITAKLIKQGFAIIEVPINYNPRTKLEGKKINFFDGIKALVVIIKYRFCN